MKSSVEFSTCGVMLLFRVTDFGAFRISDILTRGDQPVLQPGSQVDGEGILESHKEMTQFRGETAKVGEPWWPSR